MVGCDVVVWVVVGDCGREFSILEGTWMGYGGGGVGRVGVGGLAWLRLMEEVVVRLRLAHGICGAWMEVQLAVT